MREEGKGSAVYNDYRIRFYALLALSEVQCLIKVVCYRQTMDEG